VIQDLKALGFSDDIQERPRRLIVSLSGPAKTGKTHFALTAPSPIFFINIDIGTEGVLDKFQAEGKKIYCLDVRVPKTTKSEKDRSDIYVPMWGNLKVVFARVYGMGSGTVIVDTDTEAYELARLAKFGKLTQVMPHNYQEVNNEFREVLRLAFDSPMNTIFIHKVKPKWVNNARTSEFEVSGPSDIEYNVQANLETRRMDTEDGTVFCVYIKDCRQNPSLAGTLMQGLPLQSGEARTEDPLCNFEMLLSMVHVTH